MFAVKSTYSIKTPDGNEIPFYVANSEIFLCYDDLIRANVKTSYIDVDLTKGFDNYGFKVFISLTDFKDATFLFASNWGHSDFWRGIVNQDYSKVIAEVSDAQQFLEDFAYIVLPKDWEHFNVDFILDDLHTRTSDWIETCYKSLQILATNDAQKQAARRVYDEAWKILKAREKAANANKRPTVHETLAKFGLTDDDLIQAVLDVHETKFDNEQARRKTQFEHEHNVLAIELRQLLE